MYGSICGFVKFPGIGKSIETESTDWWLSAARGRWERRATADEFQIPFWGDRSLPELESGDAYTMRIYQKPLNSALAKGEICGV